MPGSQAAAGDRGSRAGGDVSYDRSTFVTVLTNTKNTSIEALERSYPDAGPALPPASGLRGGEPGARGENWLLPAADESRAERLPDKCTTRLKAGDVLRMLTPSGAGWGPPAGEQR